jgi:hypothetical protein
MREASQGGRELASSCSSWDISHDEVNVITYVNIDPLAQLSRVVNGLQAQIKAETRVGRRRELAQRHEGLLEAAGWFLMAHDERHTGEAQRLIARSEVLDRMAEAEAASLPHYGKATWPNKAEVRR